MINNEKVQNELDEVLETNQNDARLSVRPLDSTRKPLVRKVVSRQEIEEYHFQRQASLFGKRSARIHPQETESNIIVRSLTAHLNESWRDWVFAKVNI